MRNNADNLIYTAEKTKKDLDEKLTEEQKSKIDEAISALKDALAGSDLEQMKQKNDDLTKLLQDVGTAIYQQVAAEQAKQAEQEKQTPGKSSKKDKKVVDSDDYKVEDS